MTEDQLHQKLVKRGIPDYMHHKIVGYVFHGRAMGGFLCAVFDNDLKSALTHADSENLEAIHAYVMMLYNDVPCNCQGSPEIRQKWQQGGGLHGLYPEFAKRESVV